MDPKPKRYLNLGKGELFDTETKSIVKLENGKVVPTGKKPVFEKSNSGTVVKGNNGGYVGITDGKTYFIKGGLISSGIGNNYADVPTETAPIQGQPAAKNPDGSVNWLGTVNTLAQGQPAAPAQAPAPSPAPSGGGGGGKKKGPAVPSKPTAGQLMASLPTQDTAKPLTPTGPAAPTARPDELATVAGTLPPKAPSTTAVTKPAVAPANPKATGMGWQNYAGIATDLMGGIAGMAMAGRPLSQFKEPQAYGMLMQEWQNRRNQGLSAVEKGALNERNQNQYSTDVAAVSRIGAASPGTYMAGLAGASQNAYNANVQTAIMDNQQRNQNFMGWGNVVMQDMNMERQFYGQKRQEELGAANAFAQAGAANFANIGDRIDYMQQYENPNSFYNLLKNQLQKQATAAQGVVNANVISQ